MAASKAASQRPLLEPRAVADVLRATDEPITVYESAWDKPALWADFPRGFSVSHSSHDIFAGEYPVSVYFKGGTADGLKSARAILTRAGYQCYRYKANGSKRPAWLYVTSSAGAAQMSDTRKEPADYDVALGEAVAAFIEEAERLGIQQDNPFGCDYCVNIEPLSWWDDGGADDDGVGWDVLLLMWRDSGRWGFLNFMFNITEACDTHFAEAVGDESGLVKKSEGSIVSACRETLEHALKETRESN